MGHAGAIVSGSSGTAEAKKEALEAVGVRVGRTPSQTAAIVREIYRSLHPGTAAELAHEPTPVGDRSCHPGTAAPAGHHQDAV